VDYWQRLRRSSNHLAALVALAVLGGSAAAYGQRGSEPATHDNFVAVNGVRLHYVDWGGTGEPLLFLTALGGNVVRQFHALAPQFTNRLHVLGLTRRGQGLSDKPTSGYDTDNLARDLLGFLDVMHIRRVNIAGHSIAGAEMTRFATLYPDRVAKLVYLDSANDYRAVAEISAEAKLPPPTDKALAAILDGAGKEHPPFSQLKVPALNIVVAYDGGIPLRPEYDEAFRRYVRLLNQRHFVEGQVRRFQQEVKLGTTLILRDTDHNAFLSDPKQLEIVVPAIRRFLLEQ
jgi:pimeloyl-ACP methyl ester carboxylesterase